MLQLRMYLLIFSVVCIGLIMYDVKDFDSIYLLIEQLCLLVGVLNVLLILFDDVGFGVLSVFGGLCRMLMVELFVGNGLWYNWFYIIVLCLLMCQVLLIGCNYYFVGMGGIIEIVIGVLGYSLVLLNIMLLIVWMLKFNGYNIVQFGKCYEVLVWQISLVGLFDVWFSGGGGFEYFYGFIGGEVNQWYLSLYEGIMLVEVNCMFEEGYYFMVDMIDKVFGWIGQQKVLVFDWLFFVYFVLGVIYVFYYVLWEWVDKYWGCFDVGWDVL